MIAPILKGKKKKNGQILLFYPDPRTDLKAFGGFFKSKFGCDEDWVCQLLI
jgi:hypothetical protein